MAANDRSTSHASLESEANKGDQHERKVGDYTIIQKIGQGSFATVYKAQHKTTGRVVAIKSVLRSKLTKKLLENLESEISILKAIRHDHIVGLIECQKTDTHIHLVMEYCSMGDLSQYIKRKRSSKSSRSGAVPERILRHFLKQLASALKFMRSHNLVHRDIKPQNLLLIPPEESTVKDGSGMPLLKLADFGFARFLPNASLADTLCGSPLYMGPEILAYEKYDAKADLWSVGAVLYEMATGRPPFRAQNHIELLKRIQENGDKIRFPDERQPSDDASRADVPAIGNDVKDLIRKLLKKNPVERISFEEFFMHPAVTQDTQPTPSSTRSLSTSVRPKPFAAPASLPAMKTTRPLSADYDPPPFAQPPNTPRQTLEQRPLSAADRFRVAPQRRLQSDSNVPSHEREQGHGNGGWTRNDTNDPGTMMIKRNHHGGTESEEDVLHEYVVLDRRIIETNQFADEISASPRAESMDRHMRQVAIPRRGSSDLPSPSPPSLGTTPPFSIPRERKISTGSAGSALARALSMASVRLFGAGNSPPKFGKFQHQEAGSPRGFMITDGRIDAEDNQAMKDIERMACMAHAVARYADTKFDQLIGNRPGNELILAEETMVLHIKVLALLEQGLEIAKNYWNQITDENLRAAPFRLNESVQWMRERFNESLERASFAGSKCERDDENGAGVCVEKLLYDRALEMSRAAAVQELVGENLSGCEHEYQAAIWMLEAILVAPGDDDVVIEEDDHRIINKFIGSIKHRISVLRKKRDELENRAQDIRFDA